MKSGLISKIACAGMFGMTALSGQVQAQISSVDRAAAATDESADLRGGVRAQQRISAEFSEFAGSDSNALALVTGLRSATPITLTGASGTAATAGTAAAGMATAAATAAETVTFTPPTRPMGYGNIEIALSLARQQLAAQGITNPTPQQLQLALMGGTVTSGNLPQTHTVKGVLQLRSQEMGWGQIAQHYGIKLGSVIGDMNSVDASGTARAMHQASAVAGNAAAGASAGTGIRNAAGTSVLGGGVSSNSDVEGRGLINAGAAGSHTGANLGTQFNGIVNAGGGFQSAPTHVIGRALGR